MTQLSSNDVPSMGRRQFMNLLTFGTATGVALGALYPVANYFMPLRAGGGGGGTSTSAITSGNQAPQKSFTESWDGTTWTEVADRATDNYAVGGAGASNQDGIIFAGYDSSPASFPQATEEWTFSHPYKKVTTE